MPPNWQTYLSSARCAITVLSELGLISDLQDHAQQIWIIQGLQDFIFIEADITAVEDIAAWCQSAWLRLLESDPENIKSLIGKAIIERYKRIGFVI